MKTSRQPGNSDRNEAAIGISFNVRSDAGEEVRVELSAFGDRLIPYWRKINMRVVVGVCGPYLKEGFIIKKNRKIRMPCGTAEPLSKADHK